MKDHDCSFHHSMGVVSESIISELETRAFSYFYRSKSPITGAAQKLFKQTISFASAQKLLPHLKQTKISDLFYLDHFDTILGILSPLLSYSKNNDEIAHRFAHEAGQWLQSLELSLEENPELPTISQRTKNLIERLNTEHGPGSLDYRSVENYNRQRFSLTSDFTQWVKHWKSLSQEIVIQTLREEKSTVIKRLLDMAKRAQEGAKILEDIFGTTAGLWDLIDKEGFYQNMATVKIHADDLKKDPSLQRLAEILGRQEYEESETTLPLAYNKNSWEEYLGRSEIDGISYSGDLSMVLPQELSYFNEEGLDHLFTHDFINEQLLTLSFITTHMNEEDDRKHPQTERSLKALRGPVILVVDTSGSMEGPAETTAKAFSLALARVCFQENRPLHIILFSTKTVNFTLDPTLGNLYQYSQFLSFSFRGGTDLRPAVKEAIAMTDREQFAKSDVIIVSDFRIPKIFLKYSSKIHKNQKKQGMRIYAMTVGTDPIQDTTNLFDDHWHYAIDAGGNPQGIIKLKDIPSSRRVHRL